MFLFSIHYFVYQIEIEDYSNIYVTGIKTLRLWNSVFYDRHKVTELCFQYVFFTQMK